MNKQSISGLLMSQAKDDLLLAIESKAKKDIDKEVRLGMNIDLLLGIVLESVISEIGETFLDKWTWNELERSSTPLKWRIISGLKKGFEPSSEPLQTINKLQKIRNLMAHPKLKDLGTEVIIISESGISKKVMKASDVLPKDDFKILFGYGNLINEFNAHNSLLNMKSTLSATKRIKELFGIENMSWCESIIKEIESIEIRPHSFIK